jgi:glutamate racemase
MIGVFDSGHGGLTVLRALTTAQPCRRFIYLGDHAAAPYGPRGPDDIHRLTVAGVERLFDVGCSLVILACNTASAVSLRRLQQTWLPQQERRRGRNVLGVLVPVVEAITRTPWMAEPPAPGQPHPAEPHTVAIFATSATVNSGSFPKEIAKRASHVTVRQQACPGLVPLIEDGADDAALRPAVRAYVEAYLDAHDGEAPDAAVLGCTHYPLAAHLFAEALPPGVEVLSQPTLTAKSLEHYLARHPEYEATAPIPAPPRFFTTGDADKVSLLAKRFFGEGAAFEPL